MPNGRGVNRDFLSLKSAITAFNPKGCLLRIRLDDACALDQELKPANTHGVARSLGNPDAAR